MYNIMNIVVKFMLYLIDYEQYRIRILHYLNDEMTVFERKGALFEKGVVYSSPVFVFMIFYVVQLY